METAEIDLENEKKFSALLSAIVALRSEREKHDESVNRELRAFARRLKRIEGKLKIKDGALGAEIIAFPSPPSSERIAMKAVEDGLIKSSASSGSGDDD